MINLVTIVHIAICIILVIVVLLQQGKKDGMGSAFGGGSQSLFGARGAETFLEKLTKILAVIFMATSLGLVYLSSRESSESIMSNETTKPAPIGATPPSPASTVPASAAPTTPAAAPTTVPQPQSAAPNSAPAPTSKAPTTSTTK